MKRCSIFIILFFISISFPSDSHAWTERLTEQIILDAASFVPYRFAKIIKQQRNNLNKIIKSAFEAKSQNKGSEELFNEALKKMGGIRQDPQGALEAMVKALHPILNSSCPTQSARLLELIEEASSCQQARFDGIQYVTNTPKRILISHNATEQARRILKNWEPEKNNEFLASQAVGTAYHLAVNDAADMMATLWRRATGDSASTAIFSKQISHSGSTKSPFSLPAGYNPIPGLKEYYKELQSIDSQDSRASKPSSASQGTRLLELKGLRIVNRRNNLHLKENKKQEKEAIKEDIKAQPGKDKKKAPPAKKKPETKNVPDRVEKKVEHKRLSTSQKKNGLSQQAVERVIQRLLPSLGSCYQQINAGDQNGGVVTVMFTINPDGSVSDVNIVGNTTGLPALSYCVESTIKKASFPKSEGDPIRIRYPFVFE